MIAYKVLAETMGTFAIVFAGFGSIVLAEKFPHLVPGYCVPLAFGWIITIMIFAVGHVSGAHFNPAVTLAFVALKRFPANQILIYWASQFSGGLMAIAVLALLQKS